MRSGSIIPLIAGCASQPYAGTPETPAVRDARIESSIARANDRSRHAARTASSGTSKRAACRATTSKSEMSACSVKNAREIP